MVSGESPAAARRHLRLALRKAREAKRFTQTQVADALDWSLSKVQRIESGESAVSRSDLLAALDLLGVDDPAQVTKLVETARAARSKGWWDDAKYRQHLSPAHMQLLQFETEASAIRVFHPSLLPGLFQTPAYAAFILNSWSELPPAVREVRLEVRLQRRQHLLLQPDSPWYFVILDESVLLRQPGGPAMMAEQLELLLETMTLPRVIVRILPLKAMILADIGGFHILDLGDDENAILYREAQLVDEIEQTPDRVNLYRARFERMWELSLSKDATGELIKDHVAGLAHDTGGRRPAGSKEGKSVGKSTAIGVEEK